MSFRFGWNSTIKCNTIKIECSGVLSINIFYCIFWHLCNYFQNSNAVSVAKVRIKINIFVNNLAILFPILLFKLILRNIKYMITHLEFLIADDW